MSLSRCKHIFIYLSANYGYYAHLLFDDGKEPYNVKENDCRDRLRKPLLLSGCAKESSRSLEVAKVTTWNTPYHGARSPISVGKFDNRSSYMNGVFSDGVDRLGNQSKTILITHLQQTGRFNVLDRSNMAELQNEASIKEPARR